MIVALIVILLGGASVSALTSFNFAMVRAQATRQQRLALEHDADAALTTVISDVRGRLSKSAGSCIPATHEFDDVHVDISCSNSIVDDPVPRPGLVTTLNSSTLQSQTLPSWAGEAATALDGAIVINTGTQSSPSVAYLEDRQKEPAATWSTRPMNWTSFATQDPSGASAPQIPLPPIPPFERPGAQTILGTCNIFFPGRYLGTTSLLLSGGTHYFTSGVYYFERPLAITAGARVVMGEGPTPGCSTDDESVTATRSPLRHSISDDGAVVLFGGAGRLIVQDASLVINPRNQGRDPAIRTISFGTSTSTISIPADVVQVSDVSTVAVTTHTVVPPESTTAVSYKASTLAPSTALAVSVTLNGTQPDANRFVVAGPIIVPHGGVHLASSTSAYRVSITGGMVTTRLTTALPNMPTGSGMGFDVGYQKFAPSAVPSSVSIEAHAVDGTRSFTSRADFAVSGSTWNLVERTRRHQRRFGS